MMIMYRKLRNMTNLIFYIFSPTENHHNKKLYKSTIGYNVIIIIYVLSKYNYPYYLLYKGPDMTEHTLHHSHLRVYVHWLIFLTTPWSTKHDYYFTGNQGTKKLKESVKGKCKG